MSTTTTPKVFLAGKEVKFTRSDYVGQGGFGVVFRKAGVAYKICHDPKSMIPEAKFRELKVLVRPNILGPRDVLSDAAGTPVGFTMPYIDQAEFLTRLFTKSFRQQMGITQAHLRSCAMSLQQGVQFLHQHHVLGVDLNEFNFLVGKDMDMIYFIDVDGYQTPSFRATAIMDTVRDRQGKYGIFNEGTDWFSTAVIMCQIYTGAHPFKPVYPGYSRTQDWDKMMNENINVFLPEAKMPPATFPLDTIPKGHLRWLYRVIKEKERIAPPDDPDVEGTPLVLQDAKARVVQSTAGYRTELLMTADSEIVSMFTDGTWHYAATKRAIYDPLKGKVLHDLPNTGWGVSRLFCSGGFADVKGSTIEFFGFDGQKLDSSNNIRGAFSDGKDIFFMFNGKMWRARFRSSGKGTSVAHVMVASVHDTSVKAFKGCAIFDMFGRHSVVVPSQQGEFARVEEVEQLYNHRVIDAVAAGDMVIVLSEFKNEIFKTFVDVQSAREPVIQERSFVDDLQLFQFKTTAGDRSMVVYMHPVGDGQFEAFKSPINRKLVTTAPCNSGDVVHALGNGNQWGFAHGCSVYKVIKTT